MSYIRQCYVNLEKKFGFTKETEEPVLDMVCLILDTSFMDDFFAIATPNLNSTLHI